MVCFRPMGPCFSFAACFSRFLVVRAYHSCASVLCPVMISLCPSPFLNYFWLLFCVLSPYLLPIIPVLDFSSFIVSASLLRYSSFLPASNVILLWLLYFARLLYTSRLGVVMSWSFPYSSWFIASLYVPYYFVFLSSLSILWQTILSYLSSLFSIIYFASLFRCNHNLQLPFVLLILYIMLPSVISL